MDTCHNCGSSVRPVARFCTVCGQRFRDTSSLDMADELANRSSLDEVLPRFGSDTSSEPNTETFAVRRYPGSTSPNQIPFDPSCRPLTILYCDSPARSFINASVAYVIDLALRDYVVKGNGRVSVRDDDTGVLLFDLPQRHGESWHITPVDSPEWGMQHALRNVRLTHDGGVVLSLTLGQWRTIVNSPLFDETIRGIARRAVVYGLPYDIVIDWDIPVIRDITFNEWRRMWRILESRDSPVIVS